MAKSKMVGGLFTFDSALLILKAGGRVTRMAWGGRGNWVQMDRQTTAIATRHTLDRTTSDGKTSPWLPTYDDLFAGDWVAEHISDITS